MQPGERVLDIGCGTGASLLAVAARIGPGGHVLGADIAPSLLGVAQARTGEVANIETRELDAQTGDLGSDYDVCVSRFGVMFFNDTAAAFANIAGALKPGGRFSLGAWADARQNPYFMDAARVSRQVLGEMPKTDRTLPGPFAFEDPERVRALLSAAGLCNIEITATEVALTPPGSVEDYADLCLNIGPAAGAVSYFNADATAQADLRAALIETVAKHNTPGGLRVPALINYITANRD